MKSMLVLCLVAVAVYGLPAKNTESFDDSEESLLFFPMSKPHKKEVPSVVEVEVGDSDEDSSFFPSYFRPLFVNPFRFMNFGLHDFFKMPSWFDSFMPQEIPDAEVKNATSSTKVVDGHKITVNETTYENEKNGAVYRFKIIEVSPIDTKNKEDKRPEEKGPEEESSQVPESSDRTTEHVPEVKPDQNSHDNEIHREEMLASYELLGDDPSVLNTNAETINFGNEDSERRRDVVDLSGDIRVNALRGRSNSGALFMIPPDVEVFSDLDYDYLSGNYNQQQVQDPNLFQAVVKPEFGQQRQDQFVNQAVIQPEFRQQLQDPYVNQAVIQPDFNQRQI